MGERSTEHQFGLSEGRDIDKQAPHMHDYRSPAQIAPHHTYLQQLHTGGGGGGATGANTTISSATLLTVVTVVRITILKQ